MNIFGKIALFGGLIAAGGVGYYLYRQSVLAQSICYNILTLTYLGGQQGVTTFSAAVEFNNYAEFPIDLVDYNIDAYIDNAYVAKIQSDKSYVLPAKGKKVIDFIAQADTSSAISQLLVSGLEQLFQKEESYFKLKGTATIKVGIVRIKNYPIDMVWSAKELVSGVKNGEGCPAIV